MVKNSLSCIISKALELEYLYLIRKFFKFSHNGSLFLKFDPALKIKWALAPTVEFCRILFVKLNFIFGWVRKKID